MLPAYWISIGGGVGLALGAALGPVVFGNQQGLALGIGIGIALGAGLGTTVFAIAQARQSNNNKE